jgi:replicative DNA helicase
MTPAFLRHAEESQCAALSALRNNLTEAGALLSTSGVTEAHFYDHHREVFTALMEMWQQAKPFNFRSLAIRLREMGSTIEETALQTIFSESSPMHALPATIGALMRCEASRRLYKLGQRLSGSAFDLTSDIEENLANARAELDAVSVEPDREETSLAYFLKQAVLELEGHSASPDVIEFGLGLDPVAGPFMRGDLIVIAAETKGGKSAIAGNIVENVASAGNRCLVFSLEMTGVQTAERMLASQARVDIRSMKMRMRMRHEMQFTSQDTIELARMEDSIARMRDWPVDIITKKGSVAAMSAEIIRRKPALAVVDYAQLTEGIRKGNDNREREVASISSTLKRAAGFANCAVILLSQLNEDGKLRESRALGQDANCVLFLEGDEKDKRTVRVGAARSAPSGVEIELDWRPQFTRFSAND